MILTHARSRNLDGRFRQKRGDTHLGTLEKTYGEISDRRCDAHLQTLREVSGKSLTQMVHGKPEVTHKPGLDGRVRNQGGRIHAKRSDTSLATLELTYGHLCNLPGTTPLAALQKATGHSLSWMVRHPRVLEGLSAANG